MPPLPLPDEQKGPTQEPPPDPPLPFEASGKKKNPTRLTCKYSS